MPAAAPTPSGGLGFGGPQAEDGGASSAAALAASAEQRLKLSVILNLALDAEVARFPQANVREMFTSYVKLQGSEHSEPWPFWLKRFACVKCGVETYGFGNGVCRATSGQSGRVCVETHTTRHLERGGVVMCSRAFPASGGLLYNDRVAGVVGWRQSLDK